MVLDQRRLADIIDFLPDATFVVDDEGKIIAWNKAIESLTGVKADEMIGRDNRQYALPFYGKRIPILIDLALSPQQVITHQYSFLEKDNDTLIAEVYTPHLREEGVYLWAKASPLYDESGHVVGAIETIRDITKRKNAEKALWDHLHFLQVLIDAIPMPIFYKNPQGVYLGCNEAFEQCQGLSKEQVIGKTVHEIAPPNLAAIYHTADQELFRNPGVQAYESTAIFADGIKNEVLFNKATFLNADGTLGGLVGTILNISRLKHVEKALRESESKLRFLSSQLLKGHEKERRRLSMELHDDLGQTLNVLKLQIRYIEKRLRKDQEDLRVDCEYLLQYMDEIIDSVRRISRDLSPSILVDLGLTVALEHLIEEFTKNYNIKCYVDIFNIDNLFPQDSQILIFRIFQESLTNIAKHAEASQVSIEIKKQNNAVSFSIADNGKGFDLERVSTLNSTQKGLGLAAMDERVHMLDGSLNIWSQEGLGTKISFALNVK
ncbi:MAG: PAS domain-containing protein [Syntrophobacterales bacterium]|jgi:PAS domain S-box-containing protein|nr:PAS domain-containing protein [Syntrophobacterales bacterium]